MQNLHKSKCFNTTEKKTNEGALISVENIFFSFYKLMYMYVHDIHVIST